MTQNSAVMDISAACFEEIKKRLEVCGYEHCIQKDKKDQILILEGLALKSEKDQDVQVYISYKGQMLKAKPEAKLEGGENGS